MIYKTLTSKVKKETGFPIFIIYGSQNCSEILIFLFVSLFNCFMEVQRGFRDFL